MNTFTFSQSDSCQWLYLADDAQANTLFLLPPDSGDLPARISLAESWEKYSTGCYIFLRDPLNESGQAVFARAAWAYLSDPTRRERPQPAPVFPRADPHFFPRFAWFANPGEAATGLSGQSISLYRTDNPATWHTDRLNSFEPGGYSSGYALRIVKNCIVTLKTDETGFDFLPPAGFQNEYQTPSGSHSLALSQALSLAIGGEQSGAFQFGNAIASQGELAAFIKTLQPEIRYFYTASLSSRRFSIASQRYPILSSNLEDWVDFKGELLYQMSLHPLKRPVGEGFDFSTSLPDASLPSHFRTNLGYAVHLKPLRNCRLIYAAYPASSGDDEGQRLYLTLQGDFEISVPGNTSSTAHNLICGLSGVEYVCLSAHKKNILTFVPDREAFAPAFTFDLPQGNPVGSADKLTSAATTAWVYVSYEDSEPGAEKTYPLYFSQPDQAALYQKGGTGDSHFLKYMEVPAVALPSQPDPQKPSLAFPIAPYGEVAAAEIEKYQKFEAGLLSQARRDIIHQIAAGQALPLIDAEDGLPADHTGTTPQGLVTTYSGDFEAIKSLVLGRDTAGNELRIDEILRTDPLRSALQSNQLFLVISNPDSLHGHFSSHKLAIEGWEFDLDTAKWNQFNTILVLKFHNQSFQELVDAPQTWTLTEAFSKDLATDSYILSEIINRSLEKAPDTSQGQGDGEDENYRQLTQALTTPGWNGILAFNVPVPPDGLPSELKGLANSIDENRFCAQYFGIESNTVSTTGGQLMLAKSSLFGLIDYVDDRGLQADSSGYNYTVSRLNVLFQNSGVKHFAGEVVVVLDKLFGENTVLQNSLTGRNEIILAGRSELHDGRTTYAFSSSDTSRFDLPESKVINEMEIVKASFSTDPPKNSAGYQDGESVKSRFAFWGRIDFMQDPDFDILSFGSETEGSNAGLWFSNLQLLSTFKWGQADSKSLAFRAGEMVFDLKKSQPRNWSLFNKFPLKLTSLLESDGSQTPDSLGYMPIRTPVEGKSPASDEAWYGLVYDLTLGSAGALAGKAGIVISLLAAWQPGGTGKVFTGLRLPSLSAGKLEFAIQGVLKIKFKYIEIKVLKGEGIGEVSYLMKFKNIMLKFLTLELPPKSHTEIIIFGDPDGTAGGENTLAWYAAYAKSKGQRLQKNPSKALTSKAPKSP